MTANEEAEEAMDYAEELTELEEDIITEMEFIFGDISLTRNKFLNDKRAERDGWLSFNRLIKWTRLYRLSKNPEFIAETMLKSNSELLEVSADRQYIRRRLDRPVPPDTPLRRWETQQRTVYVKGVPLYANIDAMRKFFNEFGDVEMIGTKKYVDAETRKRKFKGSLFVTYKDFEQALYVVKLEGVKYDNSELLIMFRHEYYEMKSHINDWWLPTGTILHFCKKEDETKREEIREALESLGAKVAYIEFNPRDTGGWVRLKQKNAAYKLMRNIGTGKLKILDGDVEFSIVQGAEEAYYLKKTIKEIRKRRRLSQKYWAHISRMLRNFSIN